jgi:hypothetical protein
MKMNETESQEVPKEEGVSGEKEISDKEFERIYNLFHEDVDDFNKKIIEGIEQVLRDNGIGDYRVTKLTFASRNPPGWHPYVYRCDNGICIGWTYT